MKQEEQRIAIAKACGWKQGGMGWKAPNKAAEKGCAKVGDLVVSIPDYLNDLNAMHEAEKVLTPAQLTDYGCELVLLLEHKSNKSTPHWGKLAHATAAQRAEAFLRTMNLWKD